MKYSSIACVISNSEITPSLRGRTAITFCGVRPIISFASAPIANGIRVRLSIATHDGSLITMPLPRTFTRVLAVPRSMPISNEKKPKSQLRGLNANFCSWLFQPRGEWLKLNHRNHYTITHLDRMYGKGLYMGCPMQYALLWHSDQSPKN